MRAHLFPLFLALVAACKAPVRHEFSAPVMGTEFRLVLYAVQADEAEAAAQAVWLRLEELNACLSDYDRESELALLPARSEREGWVSVSEDLWCVLEHAREVSRSTQGAFDITVGPVVAHWRRARRREQLPEQRDLTAALSTVGYELLQLDPSTRSARARVPAMRLDLGGLAKGYALDEALETLREEGIDSALVDGGGDVRVGAAPPGRAGWRVELEGGGVVELVHAAIATSGDTYQFAEIDGERRSHILDPQSGAALTGRRVVSVVAPTGLRADAAATAVSVLGAEAGLAWIGEQADLEGRVLWLEKGARRACESSGWGQMMEPARRDPRPRSSDPE